MAELRGRCLCGAVLWVTEGPVLWAGHCHCDSCRRATGAAVNSFFGVPRAGVRWTGEMRERFSSQGRMVRKYCGTCGSHMTCQYDGWPDEAHLYAASLEDAAQFEPRAHFHWAEKLDWVVFDDDLPKYPGSADTTEPI